MFGSGGGVRGSYGDGGQGVRRYCIPLSEATIVALYGICWKGMDSANF